MNLLFWRRPRIPVLELHGTLSTRPADLNIKSVGPAIERAIRAARPTKHLVLDIDEPRRLARAVRPDRQPAPPARRGGGGDGPRGDRRGRRLGRLLAGLRGGRDPRQPDERGRLDRRGRRRFRLRRAHRPPRRAAPALHRRREQGAARPVQPRAPAGRGLRPPPDGGHPRPLQAGSASGAERNSPATNPRCSTAAGSSATARSPSA